MLASRCGPRPLAPLRRRFLSLSAAEQQLISSSNIFLRTAAPEHGSADVLVSPPIAYREKSFVLRHFRGHLSKKAPNKTIFRRYKKATEVLNKFNGFEAMHGTEAELIPAIVVKWMSANTHASELRKQYKSLRKLENKPLLRKDSMHQELSKELLTVVPEDITPWLVAEASRALFVLGSSEEVNKWVLDCCLHHKDSFTLNHLSDCVLFLVEQKIDFEALLPLVDTYFENIQRSSCFALAKITSALAASGHLDERYLHAISEEILHGDRRMFMFETWQLVDVLFAFLDAGHMDTELIDEILFEMQLPTRAFNNSKIICDIASLLAEKNLYSADFFRAGFNQMTEDPDTVPISHITLFLKCFLQIAPPLVKANVDAVAFYEAIRLVRLSLITGTFGNGLLDNHEIVKLLAACDKNEFFDKSLLEQCLYILSRDHFSSPLRKVERDVIQECCSKYPLLDKAIWGPIVGDLLQHEAQEALSREALAHFIMETEANDGELHEDRIGDPEQDLVGNDYFVENKDRVVFHRETDAGKHLEYGSVERSQLPKPRFPY